MTQLQHSIRFDVQIEKWRQHQEEGRERSSISREKIRNSIGIMNENKKLHEYQD
jgi:hypothetical protein